MGSNHFEKKCPKIPIKIGVSIAIAIGFVFLILFILGGAAWGPWSQAPPRIKRMEKTKPMAMAWLMPILIGTFWYFFSKWFDPI